MNAPPFMTARSSMEGTMEVYLTDFASIANKRNDEYLVIVKVETLRKYIVGAKSADAACRKAKTICKDFIKVVSCEKVER